MVLKDLNSLEINLYRWCRTNPWSPWVNQPTGPSHLCLKALSNEKGLKPFCFVTASQPRQGWPPKETPLVKHVSLLRDTSEPSLLAWVRVRPESMQQLGEKKPIITALSRYSQQLVWPDQGSRLFCNFKAIWVFIYDASSPVHSGQSDLHIKSTWFFWGALNFHSYLQVNMKLELIEIFNKIQRIQSRRMEISMWKNIVYFHHSLVCNKESWQLMNIPINFHGCKKYVD